LTEVQRRQLVLADNRIALNAGLDLEMLSLELKTWPLLVPTWRDSASPLENLPGRSPHHGGLTDEDEVPTLPDNAVSAIGVIWCAGSHRICCGDSRDAAVVAALLADVRPQLMVTDPALWRRL
jgi:hypothetical protein